jgi:hypothetical protein
MPVQKPWALVCKRRFSRYNLGLCWQTPNGLINFMLGNTAGMALRPDLLEHPLTANIWKLW